MFDLIVTRHTGLLEWIAANLDSVPDDRGGVYFWVVEPGRLIAAKGEAFEQVIPVAAHATADQVRDKRVLGVLPLSLARWAATVTEVQFSLREDQRGKEISKEDMDAAGARFGPALRVVLAAACE